MELKRIDRAGLAPGVLGVFLWSNADRTEQIYETGVQKAAMQSDINTPPKSGWLGVRGLIRSVLGILQAAKSNLHAYAIQPTSFDQACKVCLPWEENQQNIRLKHSQGPPTYVRTDIMTASPRSTLVVVAGGRLTIYKMDENRQT